MRVDILITDPNSCLNPEMQEQVCITSVLPDTGNPSVGTTTFVPGPCGQDGDTVTVYLYDVSNCTVNLRIRYTVGDGEEQSVLIKSDNISDSAICPIEAP
jgi:hypothetical protein